MGKMRSGWDFLPENGFHGSSEKGMQQVSAYSRSKPKFAKGGNVKAPTTAKTGKSFPAAQVPTPTVGAKGPDLNVKFPGNHLSFAKGGKIGSYKHEDAEPNESQSGYTHKEPEQGEHLEARRGGRIHKAGGGIARPTGMPRAPVIGMKRVRHAPSMPGGGMGRPQPGIPGAGAQGTPAFGQQPMKPRGMASGLGSMGGMKMGGMKKGGKC